MRIKNRRGERGATLDYEVAGPIETRVPLLTPRKYLIVLARTGSRNKK
jgi:hypothetical protein